MSAASNLLLSIIIARSLDAGGYGSFAVAFLIFGVLIALTRASVGQPLQITFSAAEPAGFTTALRSALGAAAIIGASSGLVVVLVGSLLSGETGKALIALGVCLPGLLVQDTCRMAFFSSGRADRAAANDGLWTLLQFAAIGVFVVVSVHDVGTFILAWGGAATVAAVFGMFVLRVRPHFRGSIRWLLDQRKLTNYLVAEYLLGQGLSQAGILMVGVPGTPADVGALRAGQVLLGPLNVIVTAATIFGIPEIARRRDMDTRRRMQFCWAASGAVCVVTTLYTLTLLLLPDSIGVQILGDTWGGAQSVLLPLGVLAFAVAIGVGPGIILYGMGHARDIFRLNLVGAPILLVLLTIGIWWNLAVGAAWAIAVTEIVLLPVLILKAHRTMKEQPEPVLGVVHTDQSSDMSGEDIALVSETDRDDDREDDAAPDVKVP